MNILLLGGTYFVGKNLLFAIKERYKDANINILNRGTQINKEDEKRCIIADRHSKEALDRELKNKKYDIIFDVSGTEKIHIENVITAIGAQNIGMYVFISSSAVYSEVNNIPFKENDVLGSNKNWGNYGENKIECEEYIKEIHKKNGMEYLILRLPYIYGKWNYVYRESYCFKRCDENRTIILPGDGNKKIQFVHIDDLINCIFALLDNKESYNDIYNIGNDVVTFEEWVQKCMQATNKKVKTIKFDYHNQNLKSRDFFPFYDYDNVLATSKVEKYFIPKIRLEEGLKECYEWYTQNKDYIQYRNYENIENKIINKE